MKENAAYRTIAGSTWVPEQIHALAVSDSYENGQNAGRGNEDDWAGSARELVKMPTGFTSDGSGEWSLASRHRLRSMAQGKPEVARRVGGAEHPAAGSPGCK